MLSSEEPEVRTPPPPPTSLPPSCPPSSHFEIPINSHIQPFFSFEIKLPGRDVTTRARDALCGSNSSVSLNRAARYDVTALGKFELAQFSFEFGGFSEVSVEIYRGRSVSMTYTVCLQIDSFI